MQEDVFYSPCVYSNIVFSTFISLVRFLYRGRLYVRIIKLYVTMQLIHPWPKLGDQLCHLEDRVMVPLMDNNINNNG